MKNLIISLKLFFNLTILTGVVYPLIVTIYAKQIVSQKSDGSLIQSEGKIIASSLIGQRFQSGKYFWSRPSAVGYDSALSGASNYGPSSLELLKQYQERQAALISSNNSKSEGITVPKDLLFASASGLDPHISPEAAQFQVGRIAVQRKVDVDQVRKLIYKLTEGRQFGILGESRINVVLLNLALDADLK